MSSTDTSGSQQKPSQDHAGETTKARSTDFAGDSSRAQSRPAGEQGSASFREDAEKAKQTMSEGASSAARDLRARAATFADEQKEYGAQRLEGVAEVVDKAASDLEQELPQAAGYVREAARGLNDFSRNLRDRSLGDMLDKVNDFARREPAAFFGTAVLGGFVLSRFLKSTSDRPVTDYPSTERPRHQAHADEPEMSRPDDEGNWPEMEEAAFHPASRQETPDRPFTSAAASASSQATAGDNAARPRTMPSGVSPTEPGMGFGSPRPSRQ